MHHVGGKGNKPAHKAAKPKANKTQHQHQHQRQQQQPQQQQQQSSKSKTFGCSWNWLGLRVSPAESKAAFLTSLASALTAGCRLGQDFLVGPNSVGKLLDGNNLAAVCVAKDAPANLHNHIVEAARARGVPVVVFPKLSQELSAALKIKSASCLGIPSRRVVALAAAETTDEAGQLLVRDAARDALCDLLLRS